MRRTNKNCLIGKLFCLILTMVLGMSLVACGQLEGLKDTKASTTSEYANVTPVYDVEDYTFFADGNGIVIDWKVTNQDELSHLNVWPQDFVSANKNYLIRNVKKTRNFEGVMSKEGQDDEYVSLDVFNLKSPTLEKKRIDLWEVSQAYLKDDNYVVSGVGTLGLFREGEVNYALVGVRNDNESKGLLLNLETGVIDGELPEDELVLTNYSYISVYPKEEGNKEPKVYVFTSGVALLPSYDGNINLKDRDTKAYSMISQEYSVAYPLVDIEDRTIQNPEGIIAVEELFLDRGVSFYDVAVIDEYASKDGKEHRITKFEDIETYARLDDFLEKKFVIRYDKSKYMWKIGFKGG